MREALPKPLPCPFCGSDDVIVDDSEPLMVSVDCQACEVRTNCHGDAREALAVWNRRQPRKTQEGTIELPPMMAGHVIDGKETYCKRHMVVYGVWCYRRGILDGLPAAPIAAIDKAG